MARANPSKAGNDTPLTAKPRHPKFFFDNTLVVLEVEGMLFNVHKYQLLKSETFSDMFKVAEQDPEEGTTTDNPIVLEGVASSDFESLLTVLYATSFSHNHSPESFDVIPAFRLANKWNFEELRNFLLPFAENKLNDIDKIAFAREFGIKEWLAPAYTKLCEQQDMSFTPEEANKLGAQSLLLFLRIREEFYRQPAASDNQGAVGNYCGACCGYTYAGTAACAKCGTTTSISSGKAPLDASNAPDHSLIGPKVEKWVNDGCSFSA